MLPIVIGVLLGLLVTPAMAGAAPPEKVEICHFNADGDPNAPLWELLEVSSRAVQAHVNQGSGFPGEPVPNMPGFTFDENCVPVADEVIYAVAYGDVDPSDGDYNADVDVLIAKLIEDSGDNAFSAGDSVVMGSYPTDFSGANYEPWQVPGHDVLDVVVADPTGCGAVIAAGAQFWVSGASDEFFLDQAGFFTFSIFRDVTERLSLAQDQLQLDGGSPSQPSIAFVDLRNPSTTDDSFVDVEVNCEAP